MKKWFIVLGAQQLVIRTFLPLFVISLVLTNATTIGAINHVLFPKQSLVVFKEEILIEYILIMMIGWVRVNFGYGPRILTD
jgi:hypothetical protein